MRNVDLGRHAERLTRRNTEVVKVLADTAIPGSLDMDRHRRLRLDRDDPASPHLISQLPHIYGQVTRIPHMDLDTRFLNPILILA